MKIIEDAMLLTVALILGVTLLSFLTFIIYVCFTIGWWSIAVIWILISFVYFITLLSSK